MNGQIRSALRSANGNTALVLGLAALALLFSVTMYALGAAAAFLLIISAAIGAFAMWLSQSSDASQSASGGAHGNSSEPSASSLTSIVAAMELPAFLLTPDLRIGPHNPAARELFPHIALGQPLMQLSRNPELLKAIDEAIAQAKPRIAQMQDRIPQGRRIIASVTPLQLADTNGSTDANDMRLPLLIQFRDLTEQDRLTQMRSDFIANASHELRTPLASLKGFIETLRGPARADAVSRERFLGIMEAQADRMTRILDDLLSLSRIEMRAHIPPASEADLVPILQSVMQGLEPIAKDARITITLNAADVPARVRGDADELVQVFQNLVQNAIKYGREGGKVDITVNRLPAEGRRADRFAITVADDGPGIAREHLPRLTERFYRVDTATSRARGGTGLGLAIAKHILNRHHGELDIASEPGRGSTFTVVLDALKS
jgi:two-component system phosphate regulon sensor histidine kinase PhoR